MDGKRTIAYRGKSYSVQQLDDGTVWIYDQRGDLAFGWPTTQPCTGMPIADRTDAEWGDIIEALKRSTSQGRSSSELVMLEIDDDPPSNNAA